MASELERALANPMDAWLQGPTSGLRAIATGQPPGIYQRKPQNAKFFTYIHEFVPGTTQSWVAGAVNIANSFNIDGDAKFAVMKQARLAFLEDNTEVDDDTIKFQVSPVSEAFNFTETFLANYGSGRFPNQLATPMVLPRTAIFTALASNRNAAALLSTIFFAHFGAKIYDNPFVGPRVYRQQKPYIYPATFATGLENSKPSLPSASTDIFTLRTDGDSDFDVRRITVVSDAPVTVQVRTDDDNWFQRAIRGELIGGSFIAGPGAVGTVAGELPFFLPVPRLVSGAGFINVQVTNLDAGEVANRCQVCFWGTRLYPAGGVNK
jgi:hypothetical protein